jgi:hypothetical protein
VEERQRGIELWASKSYPKELNDSFKRIWRY